MLENTFFFRRYFIAITRSKNRTLKNPEDHAKRRMKTLKLQNNLCSLTRYKKHNIQKWVKILLERRFNEILTHFNAFLSLVCLGCHIETIQIFLFCFTKE